MPQADQLKKEGQRLTGEARRHEKVPTYQELLDRAIEDTFPASDPIAVGGATKVLEPHTTLRDARDWTLKPGSESMPGAAGSPDAGGPLLSIPCEGIVRRVLTLQTTATDVSEVPVGPCHIEQSETRAVLHWTVGDTTRSGSMSIEDYRDRLADGSVERGDKATNHRKEPHHEERPSRE